MSKLKGNIGPQAEMTEKEKIDLINLRIDNVWDEIKNNGDRISKLEDNPIQIIEEDGKYRRVRTFEREKKQETGKDLLGRDVKERIAELERNFKCLYNRIKKLEDALKPSIWPPSEGKVGSSDLTKAITVTLQYDNLEQLLWDIDFLKRLHHPILDNAIKFNPNPDTTDASKK